MKIFWNAAPRSPTDINWRFGDAYCTIIEAVNKLFQNVSHCIPDYTALDTRIQTPPQSRPWEPQFSPICSLDLNLFCEMDTSQYGRKAIPSPTAALQIQEKCFYYPENFMWMKAGHHTADVTTAFIWDARPLIFSSVHKDMPAPEEDGKGGAANMTYGPTISLEPKFSPHNKMDVQVLDLQQLEDSDHVRR